MKNNQICLGFIGSGMVGQVGHIACYQNIPQCYMTALAELRTELGKKVSQHYHIDKLYQSHHQLLQDPQIDAVVIVTRRAATGPVVMDALNAGKHVLSEKPMAHTLEQSARLVSRAKENNLKYTIGFMKRHDAGIIYTQKLLQQARSDQRWGKLVSVQLYSHGGNFAPGIKQDSDYFMTDENRPEGLELWSLAPDWLDRSLHDDYAEFINVFSHNINLIRFLIPGKSEVISASARQKNYSIVLKFDDIHAQLDLSQKNNQHWEEGIEFHFQSATLSVQLAAPFLRTQAAKVILTIDGNSQELFSSEKQSWAFQNQAQAFIDDIFQDKTPLSVGEDCLADMQLIEDIWHHYQD